MKQLFLWTYYFWAFFTAAILACLFSVIWTSLSEKLIDRMFKYEDKMDDLFI